MKYHKQNQKRIYLTDAHKGNTNKILSFQSYGLSCSHLHTSLQVHSTFTSMTKCVGREGSIENAQQPLPPLICSSPWRTYPIILPPPSHFGHITVPVLES
jgi:hypothetical protein